MTLFARYLQRNTPGQRHVRLARAQALAREVDRDTRSGAVGSD